MNQETKPELILIRGLPGSGKSTIAKFMLNENTVHFEADLYFMVNGRYRFKPDKLSDAHQWCQRETNQSLVMGKRVIVSNTFTTMKELEPYFAIAADHKILPNVITCNNRFDNIHSVPPETMEKMQKRWEDDISELFQRYFGSGMAEHSE